MFSDCRFLKLIFVFRSRLLHPICHWAKIRSSPAPLNLNWAFKYVQLPGVQHSDLLIMQQRESCFCSLSSAGRGETSVLASDVLGVCVFSPRFLQQAFSKFSQYLTAVPPKMLNNSSAQAARGCHFCIMYFLEELQHANQRVVFSIAFSMVWK